MISIILPYIFIALLALGVIGTFFPMIPAMLYMFCMTLLFSAIDGFNRITPKEFIIFGVILLLSICIDWLSGIIGAKFGGASRRGIIFGLLGMIIGFFLAPPFGGFVGIFVGVLIAELSMGKDRFDAIKAASASLTGAFAGVLVNAILACIFLVLFIVLLFV